MMLCLSAENAGNWSVEGAQATWRYAVAVPTAVSLSFHAVRISLPDSAVLVVRGAKTTTTYGARDVHRGELWSRIHPGDALELALTVAAADQTKVAFALVSLQAGYRSLGPGVEDHPYYRQLKVQQAAATGDTACITNYECQVTSNNAPAAAATVGLVTGNQFQCTGALINDVPHDNTPYVLTARHCENGVLGGGNPGAASATTVYWDATTSCGSSLGSLYDPGIPTQTGAQTVIEQQDAWLIQLDVNPVVADAQFAGFDASGGVVQGGYTIQHAEGNDKQFTAWNGPAFALQQSNVLNVTYVSNFWETVNAIGNIGPGASGSGLFDQNNHLVGTLALGRQTSDPSGYGSCPVANPPNPNGSNGVADFTSLAAVWNSTADTTSSTGANTLKSTLDPANTGTRVVPSMAVAPINFAASPTFLDAGQTAQLSWNVPNASQCTAGGGAVGDGWSGTLPATGTKSVTESAGLTLSYKLTCALTTGGRVSSSVTINWYGPVPFVQVYLPRPIVWTTRPAAVTWSSNVAPCSVSGGGLSQSGLPSSGSITTTQNSPADVTYQVSCGSGPTAASGTATLSYIAPSLLLLANASDRRLGETFQLGWLTYADTCTPSGGAPNDGWATNSFIDTEQTFTPRVSAVGTYTYSLSCSSGSLSVAQSVTVTFENNAAYVTASVSPSTTTFSNSPADYVTVNWASNLSTCGVHAPSSWPVLGPPSPFPNLTWDAVDGTEIFGPTASGTYTFSVICSPVLSAATVSSPPLTVTIRPPPPPTATISISPASVLIGQNFTITWSSTNAASCDETGGATTPGGLWGIGTTPSGTQTANVSFANSWTLGITCRSFDINTSTTASAQANLTVAALAATLTSSAPSIVNGQSFTLTWISNDPTGCTASGGGATGTPWTGPLAASGTTTQLATTTGSFVYQIDCSAYGQSVTQMVSVAVNPASNSSGGSGGGGGGAIGVLELALLAALRGGLQRARSRGPPIARSRATMKTVLAANCRKRVG